MAGGSGEVSEEIDGPLVPGSPGGVEVPDLAFCGPWGLSAGEPF